MEDTPATRRATKARIGPWYVLQSRNPSAPGMKWETLVSLVRKGQVTARSVVRGPTTQQLWQIAATVKGLSREFGLCYDCGESIHPATLMCPHCHHAQEPPADPDLLIEADEPMGTIVASIAEPAAPAPTQRPVRRPPPAVSDERIPEAPTKARGLLDSDDVPASVPMPTVVATVEPPPAPPPPAPRGPNLRPDGKILTPEDLVAAFKVEMKPDRKRSAAARGDGPPVRPGKRSHWLRNTILTLILLGIVGAVVTGYLRPDLKAQASTWAAAQFDTAKRWIAAKPAAPTMTPPSIARQAPLAPLASSDSHDQALPDATPSSHTESPAKLLESETPSAAPPPAPMLSLPTPATLPALADIKPPAPELNTSEPAAAKPTESPDPADPTNLVAAAMKAKTLRSSAIDAEQHHDYGKALQLYEQIKKLPEDAWPSDLDVRLARVKKQLADLN